MLTKEVIKLINPLNGDELIVRNAPVCVVDFLIGCPYPPDAKRAAYLLAVCNFPCPVSILDGELVF